MRKTFLKGFSQYNFFQTEKNALKFQLKMIKFPPQILFFPNEKDLKNLQVKNSRQNSDYQRLIQFSSIDWLIDWCKKTPRKRGAQCQPSSRGKVD